MRANYELLDAFGQIIREKSVDKTVLIETLEAGLMSAAKRKFGSSCEVEVKFDEESGTIKMALLKNVVEEVTDRNCEMTLREAKGIDAGAELGSRVAIPLSVEEFGRNAIQAAKQVLIQRVREAEREKVYEIFHDRIGTLVTGTVQQVDRGNIILKLERSEAIVPTKELMRRDRYRQGDHIRAVVISVDKSAKGPQVSLSRTRPEFVQRLFEGEVPEIAEGIVEIKGIAREAGSRSKVAVSSNDDKVDAVGACVGIKGTRVQSIVRELGGERIDVISWSADPTILVSRALSPAKVSRVSSNEAENKLTVVVSDDQLSLAIGKGGQNARLAAKLVGWRIDLVSQAEFDARELIDAATRIEIDKMKGVGPKLAGKLLKAGLETVEDVHKASLKDLLAVPGVGGKTAAKLKEVAQVTYEGARKAAEKARVEAELEALEAAKEAEKARAAEKAEAEAAEKAEAEAAEKAEAEAAEKAEAQAVEKAEAEAAEKAEAQAVEKAEAEAAEKAEGDAAGEAKAEPVPGEAETVEAGEQLERAETAVGAGETGAVESPRGTDSPGGADSPEGAGLDRPVKGPGDTDGQGGVEEDGAPEVASGETDEPEDEERKASGLAEPAGASSVAEDGEAQDPDESERKEEAG